MKSRSIIVGIVLAILIASIFYLNLDSRNNEQVENIPSHVLGQELHQIREPMACKEGMLVEIFAYQCPHCWKLEEHQEMMKRVSTSFAKIPTDLGRKEFIPYLKLNFVVDMLKLDSNFKHEAMRLYHEEAKRFTSDNAVVAWLAQQGADPVEVHKIITSEQLQARMNAARKIIWDAGITSVPTIIVNGRYLSSPHLAGGYDNFEKHLKELLKLPHTCKEIDSV